MEATVPFNQVEEGMCVKCGERPRNPRQRDVLCVGCGDEHERSITDLTNLRMELQKDEDFMSQFKYPRDFVNWFVEECLVRLSSPITGEFYDSYTRLARIVGYSRDTVAKSMKKLSENSRIIVYEENRKSNYGTTNRLVPIVRVNDTPPVENIRQPVFKRFRFVGMR